MSGHNKWSKIKHKKAASDSKKSQLFSKYSKLIASESKKVGGDINSPSLIAVIEKAKKDNMPKENIERAIKKGGSNDTASMENITYESYGPGGCAIIIEALTENRNKAAQEIKHILSKNGFALAGSGSATWAFTKTGTEWFPNTTIDLSDEDLETLGKLVEELESNDEVQSVFTNVE